MGKSRFHKQFNQEIRPGNTARIKPFSKPGEPGDFEALVAQSLGTRPEPVLTDREFLARLELGLRTLPTQTQPVSFTVWWRGIAGGIAVVAAGLVLLAGLTTLPPLLTNASLAGAAYVENGIRQVTIRQTLWWERYLLNFQAQHNAFKEELP